MVTVHIITYNEEVMIGFCIEHYRKKFPNCIIKIYDNYSTDNTVAIAEGYGCEISNYNSYDKFDEQTWMSYIFQETKKGNIKSALLFATPTEHDRFEHYDRSLRKES